MGLLGSIKEGGVKGLVTMATDKVTDARVDAGNASRTLNRQFHETHRYGAISIDTDNRLMRVKASVPVQKSGLRKAGELTAAVMTAGMSLAVTSQLGKPKDAIVRFDDIRGYEVLEDDAVVQQFASRTGVMGTTVGGVGVGSANTRGASATSGAIDSMILRIDVNDFANPALFVSYISKRTRRSGKEYQRAITVCHQAIQCLELILSGA